MSDELKDVCKMPLYLSWFVIVVFCDCAATILDLMAKRLHRVGN